MRLRTLLILATVAFATGAYAQDESPNRFLVRYASNLNKGDSFINITNTGTELLLKPPGTTTNLCVNVYTLDPSEEMVSCCACLVTPNALVSLSVQGDLISNTLSPSTPTAVVIYLTATVPGLADTPSTCSAAAQLTAATDGMRAWGTTLHALPGTPTTYGVTEDEFLQGGLSIVERLHLASFCGFIQANGSGFGICKSCRTGGLAGAKQ